MSQPREIELKFDIDPSAVEALRRHPLLNGQSRDVQPTVSTYFDTPKGKLRRAGVTLRLRSVDDSFVQTVKQGELGGAGLFDRAEWECRVASLAPDLDKLQGTAAEALLCKAKDQAALAPVIKTEVSRATWQIVHNDAAIEVVLDEGEVTAAGASHPLAEVELELKRGPPAALFALARTLAEAVPLRLGVLAKSEQGFRLLAGKPQQVVKAEPVALDRAMTAGHGFMVIAASCLRHFRLNEPAIIRQRDGEALHQARVALRRLRSAFSVFRPIIADARSDGLRADLSALSDTLGSARDLDVFIAKQLDGVAPPARDDVLAERERAYDEVLATLDSAPTRSLMLDLVEWMTIGDWRDTAAAGQPLPDFAEAALDRFWRKVRKQGRNLAALDDERRHEVRIAGKKLRYACDFFEALYTGKKQLKRRAPFMRALERLQSDLGNLNDLVTARELAGDLSARIGVQLPDPQAATRTDRAPDLLASAEKAHAELVEAGPFWR